MPYAPRVVSCPACGAMSSDARFCPACGSPLSPAAADRRERRVVTSLFCDLVAFTAQSEASDREGVARMLIAYFRLARGAIERHGGVVEKFIGDAVVGIFGAPVAHEDDPARAVRAGLEICSGARRLTAAAGAPLRLRVGVNTGEALVHLDARPAAGEPVLVGDAINTAARIQSAAPELGVAVGDRTWGATRLGFDYEELPQATLKGKAELVRIFHARSERQVRGSDAARTHAGRYVGRVAELARLREAYVGVRDTRRTRLAVIVGDPGMGKSRILSEFGTVVRAMDVAARWHQGRCLPYGDGTGFWALGEIIKSHAGILDGDDAATAAAQLAATLAGAPDGVWLQERILPLLGLGGVGVMREEQFAAWARYLRSMAGSGTAVIALEDVHWADPAMLAFIDVLCEPGDAPLLVVLTTRPTITEAAPHLGAGSERPVRLELRPLTDQETEALVVGLLGSIVPTELQAPILERSRGNPLYAEELVRLLGDRDLLERREGIIRLRPGVTIPLPETINGLLAARLDAIPQVERSVLARAAVVGEIFWRGAVVAISGSDSADVHAALDSLERRQLVRRQEPSSLGGEEEYAFWHVLLRDVAYQALPRRDRIDGHLATAGWIEATSGDRGDVAGLVAHHLSTAHDLALATGDRALGDALRPRARAALAQAAQAASTMDPAAGLGLYRRALDLATGGDPARPGLLHGYGVAAASSGRTSEAIAALDEALGAYEAMGQGDSVEAASVLVALRAPLMAALDLRWQAATVRALDILEPLGPSALLVEALVSRAWMGMWATPPVEAGTYADRALAVASAADLPMPVEALAIRGQARMALESPAAGFADFELAFETALARREWERAGFIAENYAGYLYFHHGVARSEALTVRALEICDAHGLKTVASWHRIGHASALAEAGRLADAHSLNAAILDDLSASGNRLATYFVLGNEAAIALIHDDRDRLRALMPALDAAANGDNSDGVITDVVIHAARTHKRLGDRDRAGQLLRHAMGSDRAIDRYWLYLAPMTRLALSLGELELAAQVPAGVSTRALVQRLGHRTNAALVAEARGSYEEAATAFREVAVDWAEVGLPLEHAAALLGSAPCPAGVGGGDAGRAPLGG